MPMYEYECPKHGKFESYNPSPNRVAETRPCPDPKCGKSAPRVEITRPARRNPAHGIQR